MPSGLTTMPGATSQELPPYVNPAQNPPIGNENMDRNFPLYMYPAMPNMIPGTPPQTGTNMQPGMNMWPQAGTNMQPGMNAWPPTGTNMQPGMNIQPPAGTNMQPGMNAWPPAGANMQPGMNARPQTGTNMQPGMNMWPQTDTNMQPDMNMWPQMGPGTQPGMTPSNQPNRTGETPYMNNPNYQEFPNMYLPNTNPYSTPMGVPLFPLYGYDNSADLDKDLEYMKYLYPNTARTIQSEIDRQCDQMEYDGSIMFDEYPDKVSLERIVDRIYDKVKDLNEEPQVESQSLYFYPVRPRNNYLRDLVNLVFLNEIFNRRRRYRGRKRWF
jgi:hypothetical protein